MSSQSKTRFTGSGICYETVDSLSIAACLHRGVLQSLRFDVHSLQRRCQRLLFFVLCPFVPWLVRLPAQITESPSENMNIPRQASLSTATALHPFAQPAGNENIDLRRECSYSNRSYTFMKNLFCTVTFSCGAFRSTSPPPLNDPKSSGQGTCMTC